MRAFKVAAATVGLSAALTGTAVGLAGPVSAAPGDTCAANRTYPPAQSTVALSRSRAEVGMKMSYEARCMKPNEKATATVYSTPVLVGTPTVDANGSVSGSFTVPNLKPGRHTLEIRGLESGAVQSASFIVVPNAAAAGSASNSSDPSSLAFTGSDAAKTAGAGAVLLLGGGALIVAARRRKHVNAAA